MKIHGIFREILLDYYEVTRNFRFLKLLRLRLHLKSTRLYRFNTIVRTLRCNAYNLTDSDILQLSSFHNRVYGWLMFTTANRYNSRLLYQNINAVGYNIYNMFKQLKHITDDVTVNLNKMLADYSTDYYDSICNTLIEYNKSEFSTWRHRALLTFTVIGRRLFISLVVGRKCMFTLSTGMFYVDIYKHTLVKRDRLALLEYRRSLKRKERKQYNRTKQVNTWKALKHTQPNRLLMVQYAGTLLTTLSNIYLDIRVKGVCSDMLDNIINILFNQDTEELTLNINDTVTLGNIYFSGIFINRLTMRRLKRNLRKRIVKYNTNRVDIID